jgi:Sec-independent protein translocase protein TatA
MISILVFLLILVFIILLFGLSLIGNVLRVLSGLFGLRRRTASGTKQGGQSYRKTENYENRKGQETQTNAKRKKRIQKDEGEYVDYEEV